MRWLTAEKRPIKSKKLGPFHRKAVFIVSQIRTSHVIETLSFRGFPPNVMVFQNILPFLISLAFLRQRILNTRN